VALVVVLLQEAYPKTWERLLRNRLGAADPADLTPAEFAGFTEHVFWLVKQTGIRDPAAWLAFRAQLDAQEAPAAPAKLGSRLEIDHLAVQRKSAEREPVALENSPVTTSAASPPQPVARTGACEMTKAEVLSRTKAEVEAGANPLSPLQRPVLHTERPVPSDNPNEPGAGEEITKDGKRYVSANRYAEMLGISRRQLSRLDARGKTSPKFKIGNKVFFEVS
jgi:hypothetical protein